MSASRRPIEDTIAYVRPNGEVRCSRPLSIRAATAVASRSASSKGTVLIDDLIQDRVEDRFRAETQQLWCLLQPAAHLGKIRRFGMADCDYELGTDEHVQLAELHLLHIIEISRGRSTANSVLPYQSSWDVDARRSRRQQPSGANPNSRATNRSSWTSGRYSPIHAMPFRSPSSS
jgi:hypothetical protein